MKNKNKLQYRLFFIIFKFIFVLITSISCFFSQIYAIELGIGAIGYKKQTSDINLQSNGTGYNLDISLIYPISKNQYSLFIRNDVSLKKNTKILPFGAFIGGIYYSNRFKKKLFKPFLTLAIGYIQSDIFSCYYDSEQSKDIGCIKKSLRLESSLGLRAEFNKFLYIFASLDIFSSTLYSTEEYPNGQKTTYIGFLLKTTNHYRATSRISAGVGLKL